MQLGFVIDHTRCIGCHACTVACKAENDVPVGSFRTWVKYTERGTFPDVRRSFAVLRCNQCSDAPCVTICPVNALEKRPDGIVDVDPQRCIGCKSCLQGCPYDALYINEDSGTAQKCHFCAHRVEGGMAPACAVVCPTEAIIPGDFHDPESAVSRLRASTSLEVRKPQAGTGPNVMYREVAPGGIDPLRTHAGSGSIWADRNPSAPVDPKLLGELEARAESRTVYDVTHAAPWGWRVSAYLFTKSLAAGFFLAALPLLAIFAAHGEPTGELWRASAGLALFFLAVTSVLLVVDLKRPERFWFILRYPNWRSWLARGTVILGAYGALLAAALALSLGGDSPGPAVALPLAGIGAVLAVLTAVYTAWLFRQARGRVLWMRRGLAWSLFVHAWVAGAAGMLLVASGSAFDPLAAQIERAVLAVGLVVHLVTTLLEHRGAPEGRRQEFELAAGLVTRGPYARRHWSGAVFVGTVIPLALLAPAVPPLWGFAPLAVWLGLWIQQDTLVRAGQALPIS